MKGAEVQAEILKKEGVEFITLFPDIELTDAAASLGIRTIMTRKERVAVDIANGVSRVSNGKKIGVCTMQPAAGIQNAYAGVAQAFADSSPILVLPEVVERRQLRTFPGYNAFDSFTHVSKWADTILFADQIPDLMRRAFTALRTGRYGPVMLELPGDVAREEFEGDLTYKPVKGWRSSADPGDVKKGVRALREAKSPVIYAGQGVLYAEAWDELRMFSEAMQIPVLTTMTGKSAFPENHPLSLGLAAHVRTPAAKHFLEGADLVFAVGAGLSRHWMQSPIPRGARILQLTNCAYDIGKGYPVDYAILGDAKLALSQMLKEVEEGPRVSEKEDMWEEIQVKKEEWFREWEPLLTSDEKPINPVRVIWDLMNTVDRENTIVTPESGKPRDHMATTYQAITPRSYLGFGHSTTLGFTLGCAMGAKLAEPKKLVVNLMGDGAFGMVGMDVETAVREEIPILTIILNNSTLSTIGMFPTASRVYKTGAMTGNYAELAESLGAHGERVEQPDEVVPAIKRCIQKVSSGKPCLLEFITKLESKVSR